MASVNGRTAADQIEVDVAIVGAGLSGLACARRLAQAGATTCVLEARERVGGRTLNAPVGDGKVVEVGGQWVGPGHRRIRALAAEVGVETFPTHIAGAHLYSWRGRVTRYRSDVPRRNLGGFADYRLAQVRLERMARRVDLESPASDPLAARWDTETLESWISRHIHTRSGRELMRLSLEAVLAVDAAEISLLHWLFYIRAGGGLDSLIRTRGGYQQDRFVGGSQEIALRLAEELGEQVRLRSPVRRIQQRHGGVRLSADSGAVDASLAVLAIPPALTASIEFDPPLPGIRQQLAQRMPAGTVIKFTAIYDEPFWRSAGLSGHATSLEGPVKVIFDNSPPDASPGALLAFALAGDARRLAALPASQRTEAVLGRLGKLFGPQAARPRKLLEQDWASEPWTRGCYAGYFGPGGWSDFAATLRRPTGRLHWAGTETATEAQATMDGAVRAGERAAAEALARLSETGTADAAQAPAKHASQPA